MTGEKPRPSPMDRTLVPTIVLLVLGFALFECSNLDLWFQDQCFHFSTQTWLVDAKSAIPRWCFYTGPKIAIWIFGVFALMMSALPSSWRAHLPGAAIARRDWIIVTATLALSPLLVATGKATTNVFTPDQIRRYGGFAPYVKVCEHFPHHDRPNSRGRGFPAGHASGGFALLSLCGLARTRRGRTFGLTIGILLGTTMGFYQIFKGAHYLSHTYVTALFCWIIFLLLRRYLPACGPPPSATA